MKHGTKILILKTVTKQDQGIHWNQVQNNIGPGVS